MATKRKPKTEVHDLLLGLIVDKSGSMGENRGGVDVRSATIEGLNTLLRDNREHPDGQCFVSMTLFNTGFEPRFVATDVVEIPDFSPATYQPGGGTALYDGVGVTIEGLDGWLANHPEFTGKVAIAVYTDGEENSSVNYYHDRLMDLIGERQRAGWEFMFLGAGGSAWTEGRKFAGTIGVMHTASVAPTRRGYAASYAASSMNTTSLRSTGSTMPIADSYNEAYDKLADLEEEEDSPTP